MSLPTRTLLRPCLRSFRYGSPPVAPDKIPEVVVAAGATLLTEQAFDAVVHESAYVVGSTQERQFGAAVELFRDWLARHDPAVFQCLTVTWEELACPKIAVDNQLQIELHLNRRTPISAHTRAHVSANPLTFCFADVDALSEDDAGGRVVASLFSAGDRNLLALAWCRSWARALKGERGTVTLASDSGDEVALASLFEQARGTAPTTKQRPAMRESLAAAGQGMRDRDLPVRRLKSLEDLTEKTVDVVTGEGDGPKGNGRRGLRQSIPPGKRIGGSMPAPRTAPLAYSEDEKEELALSVLQVAINGESTRLRDYRHLRGVGADALDKLRRYFEMKATYGPLPDEITLTANEAERAFNERDKFFLAVVAGLEEGYETVVKIFPNPLASLELKPSTSMTLTGIRTRGRALSVQFPEPVVGTLHQSHWRAKP